MPEHNLIKILYLSLQLYIWTELMDRLRLCHINKDVVNVAVLDQAA